MRNIRELFLPYCLKKQSNGQYIVLNRAYEPLGFHRKRTSEGHNETWPNNPAPPVKLRIRSKTAAKLSHLGDPDTEVIFLYADACIRTKTHMNAYMERLELLSKLKVIRSRREW
jgi:hypothetical protein